MSHIDQQDRLFRDARSQNGWTDKAVAPENLRQLYELLRLGADEHERVARPLRVPCFLGREGPPEVCTASRQR